MIVSQKNTKVKHSEDAFQIMKAIYKSRPEEEKHKEYFYIIGLNSQNIVLYVDLTAIGTIHQAVPYVRECVRLAIIKNASGVIAIHNHPSGDFQPSREDISFTKRLKEACMLLDINLLDHLILVNNEYYSFSDNDIL